MPLEPHFSRRNHKTFSKEKRGNKSASSSGKLKKSDFVKYQISSDFVGAYFP
jgi:hypothetical protein